MREGVCFLWPQWLYTLPACLAHILSWLWRRAAMHVWSQAKTDTQKSHSLGRRKPCIFCCRELLLCLMKMMIARHFSTHMEYSLMTKHTSRNRPRTDGLLLNICSPPYLQGLSWDLKDEISSAFPPILHNINLKGALKEQAAQATCAEKFCNDAQNHPWIIGTNSYTSMSTSDP